MTSSISPNCPDPKSYPDLADYMAACDAFYEREPDQLPKFPSMTSDQLDADLRQLVAQTAAAMQARNEPIEADLLANAVLSGFDTTCNTSRLMLWAAYVYIHHLASEHLMPEAQDGRIALEERSEYVIQDPQM